MRTKVKVLSFIGGELAFLSFMYSTKDKLFFPDELYGKFFYVMGLSLCIAALLILFVATFPVGWVVPANSNDLKKIKYTSYMKFLDYTKNNYIEAVKNNLDRFHKKQQYLDFASYFLVIGAVVLIVIKNFK